MQGSSEASLRYFRLTALTLMQIPQLGSLKDSWNIRQGHDRIKIDEHNVWARIFLILQSRWKTNVFQLLSRFTIYVFIFSKIINLFHLYDSVNRMNFYVY